MTIPRLRVLNAYWGDVPPVHVSLYRLNRAVLKEEKSGASVEKKQGFADFIAQYKDKGNVG